MSVPPVVQTRPAARSSKASATPWWRTAVVYQIYPRSFADSNGDGIGDLPGIRSRLEYLADLGVDALWLSPFYPSPQADAGYDVSDYRDVEPIFGTLDDARALVAESHDRGLRVIVDIVPNHTSDQHVWFRAALAAPSGSPERDRYLFRPGRGQHGERPPNNWESNFGGPAWTRVPDGEWYLHLFASEQPDLNWSNPEVVSEFQDILRFWLELGVDGFRIDVAHGLAKDPAMADAAVHLLTPTNEGDHPFWDRDEVHEIYRGWRRVAQEFGDDRVFVAEAWVPNSHRFAQYLRPDELHTAFNFNFLEAGWDATRVRKAVDQTIEELREVGAPPTWVLSNHDVVRHRTRFGGGDLGLQRALASTLLTLALPGGAYLYQGEELGLEEVQDIPAELRQDPIFARTGGERVGRDGCRVPLPWSGTESPFGFGPAGEPWLPQPLSWSHQTVAAEEAEADSPLHFYRAALAARRRWVPATPETVTWLASGHQDLLVFTRSVGFGCAVNFSAEPVALPAALSSASVILASRPVVAGVLPANAAAWFDRTE